MIERSAGRVRWHRPLGAGAIVLLFAAATWTEADPDLWGHLKFGLDLAASHRLTAIDPYSFTQDAPWVNHEWLSELQMAGAYLAGGTPGLVLLKGALVFTALTLVWTSLRGTDFAVRLAIVAIVALGTGRITKTMRPQLWSLVCFAILCRLLAEHRHRALRWLPLVFVVWANVHGGWLVGGGALAIWAVADAKAAPAHAGRWALVGIGCVAATLCTPYGSTLWSFMWRTVGMGRDITEWQPLWTVPPVAWLPWIAAAAVTIWAAMQRDADRLSRTLVLAWLAYTSLRVERVTPFFVIGAALFIAPLLPRVHAPSVLSGSSPYEPAVALVLAGVMATAGVWVAARTTRCIPVAGTWVTDDEAATSLDSARDGRLVTIFDWGEYAIWRWGPRLRVSMDGRRETVYSDARVAEHDAILRGDPKGLAALATWRPEYVWLPASSTATSEWLARHEYRIEKTTPRSFVAARADLPVLVRPEHEASERSLTMGGSRCFPQ